MINFRANARRLATRQYNTIFMLITIEKASSNLEEVIEEKEFKTLEELFNYARKLKISLIIFPNLNSNTIMIYDTWIE